MSKLDVSILCPRCKAVLGPLSSLPGACSTCSFEVRRLHGVPVLRNVATLEGIDCTTAPDGLLERSSEDEAKKIPFIREALDSGKQVLQLGSGVDVAECPTLMKTDAFVYSKHLDLVVDAHDLPFADNSFDYVYSMAVFEHLHSPWVAAREIFRVLKPGGRVYVLTAFFQHLHGYPYHYFNMTVSGAQRIFSQFEHVRVEPSPNSSFEQVSFSLVDLHDMIVNWRFEFNKYLLRPRSWWMIFKLNRLIRSVSNVIAAARDHSDELMALPQNRDYWMRIAPGLDIYATKPKSGLPVEGEGPFKGEVLRD